MAAVSGKDAVKAFERLGFQQVRVTGSHVILKKEGHDYVLAVPVHGNKSLKKGTLRGLIRGAGVTRKEFMDQVE